MKLLEIKDRIINFIEKHDTISRIITKFIIALIVFVTINKNIGYFEIISSAPVAIGTAIACALLPVNAILWFAMFAVMLDMYALSPEVAIVVGIVFLIFIFLYCRFAPEDGILMLFTPILFRYHIPYVMPVAAGLLRGVYSAIGVALGTVIFYFIDGIKQNADTLKSIASSNSEESTTKINVSLNQILGNKELVFVLIVMVISTLVVYIVRRRQIEHAWTIATFAGALIQIGSLIAGYMLFNLSDKTLEIIIGNVIAIIVGLIIQFFFMNLDYSRVENVQFEDDDYYYYVKAVPKKMLGKEEKTVKHFGNTTSIGKKIPRENEEK